MFFVGLELVKAVEQAAAEKCSEIPCSFGPGRVTCCVHVLAYVWGLFLCSIHKTEPVRRGIFFALSIGQSLLS